MTAPPTLPHVVEASFVESLRVEPATPADFARIAELTGGVYRDEGLAPEAYLAQLADVAGRAEHAELLVARDEEAAPTGSDVVGSVALFLAGEFGEVLASEAEDSTLDDLLRQPLGYSEARGTAALRSAMAATYDNCDADNILVTTGAIAFPSTAKYINSTIQEAEFAEGGLAQVRTSGQNLKELSNIVQDNASAVRQIAAAVNQQNVGISQITQAVNELSKMMDETVARIGSTGEAATTLQIISEQLSSAVKSYRVE